MTRTHLGHLLISIGLTLLLGACGMFSFPMGSGWLSGDGYSSNGERIYFTATSEQGNRIRSIGGPRFGGMMTGRLTCAACHGSDGRGGVHFMHMQTMDAPDIRWVTLSSSEHGGDHGDGDEHGEETAYDVEAFMHTIREGVTPGGARLSRDMPRWEMDDDDLKDLIGYLSTLP